MRVPTKFYGSIGKFAGVPTKFPIAIGESEEFPHDFSGKHASFFKNKFDSQYQISRIVTVLSGDT
ncbi:hypothetical protein DLM76_16940 [Leptospira yasudae]|nr:hypothetical protein DLM76_16940 [Leptospira yasudae]